jgi:hypothetical protein
VKNLSLNNDSYVEHAGRRDSMLIFPSLGMRIFLAIEIRNFKKTALLGVRLTPKTVFKISFDIQL